MVFWLGTSVTSTNNMFTKILSNQNLLDPQTQRFPLCLLDDGVSIRITTRIKKYMLL